MKKTVTLNLTADQFHFLETAIIMGAGHQKLSPEQVEDEDELEKVQEAFFKQDAEEQRSYGDVLKQLRKSWRTSRAARK